MIGSSKKNIQSKIISKDSARGGKGTGDTILPPLDKNSPQKRSGIMIPGSGKNLWAEDISRDASELQKLKGAESLQSIRRAVVGAEDGDPVEKGLETQADSTGRRGNNVVNGSFSNSVNGRPFDLKNKELMKRFIKVRWVILAVAKFWRILEHIKLYGTSSNLYNIAFKNREFVKKSIFPIAKTSNQNTGPVRLFCLFHPQSIYLAIWNLLLFLFVIYAMSFMPYFSVFLINGNDFLNNFENSMDACFMVDLIINFFTAFYDPKGNLVASHKEIALNYLKGFFLLDLVSSIPFGIIFTNVSSFNKLLRLFKIPRLMKMMKIAKLFKFRDYYRNTSLSYFVRIHGGLIKTILLGIVTLILLHLATCVWCSIGYIDGDAPFTWIYRYKLLDSSNFEIYLTGLYFCLVTLTTVGYGDYTAYTNLEICFAIVWMLVGVAFYSFTIGIISAFFTGKETKDSLLAKKLNNLDEFCKELNIKEETKLKLKASIEYSANKITYQWLDPKQVIFNELPMRLKYEMLVSLYEKLILDCPFFNSYDISFVIKIVPLLKPLFMKANEVIWKEGDYSSFVFFLVDGQVNFFIDYELAHVHKQTGTKGDNFYNTNSKYNYNNENILESENNGLDSENIEQNQNQSGAGNLERKESNMNSEAKVKKEKRNTKLLFKIMTNGSYFGEVDIIFRRKRMHDLITATDCEFYILSRTEFENIVMNEYPHIFISLRQLAFNREEKDLGMINDSLTQENKKIKEPIDQIKVPLVITRIRKILRDSICTEVDNHEVVPLEQMFEEMKEKLPLEELLDNFEVSKSENEDDKEDDDKEDSDTSEVKYSDVISIGLEKMYNQFQDLNQNLKTKMELHSKLDGIPGANNGHQRRNRMLYTNIDTGKGVHRRRNSKVNLEFNAEEMETFQKRMGQAGQGRSGKPGSLIGNSKRGTETDLKKAGENTKVVGLLSKHAEAINARMNDLLKRSEKVTDGAKKLSAQLDAMIRE